MRSVFETLRQAAQNWQVPKADLTQRLAQAARAFDERLRHAAQRVQVHQPGAAASDKPPHITWMTLARPTLGDARTPLRRVAEPVVAILAVSVLAAMSSLAALSLAGFVFACLMTIAILTQVFGLSLDLDLPRPKTP